MPSPIDLSAFADPILDELISGEPTIDGTHFLEILSQVDGPILELGCGYGRITIPLYERGIRDITGLELCAPSLAYARARSEGSPIRWVEADVCDFHLGRHFAFIFARGDVFDFLLTREDQEAMLVFTGEHLADGGRFMMDTSALEPSRLVNVPEESEWYTLDHPNGRKIYASGTDRFDFQQQLFIQTCWERWDSPDGELVRPPWTLTLRYYLPQEIEAMLHYNGFEILERYVDYGGALPTADEPARIYVCAKR